MSFVEFDNDAWQQVVGRHNNACGLWDCGVAAYAVYDPDGTRVAADLAVVCGGLDEDGFAAGVAQHVVDTVAVAYPGCEVLVWANPFTPMADRRGVAFQPAATSGGSR